MCLIFYIGINLPNTLLALLIIIWQSLSQLLQKNMHNCFVRTSSNLHQVW